MLLVIAAVVAAAFLFWYFHLLSLQQMTQLSGGLPMPDSMVFGFGQGDLQRLHASMDANARGQLQFVHKTAGTLFPLVFAVSLLSLIAVLVRRSVLRWLLWFVPILFAIVQICANFAIDSALDSATPSSAQASVASMLVIGSWVLLVLSLVCAVIAFETGRAARRRRTES